MVKNNLSMEKETKISIEKANQIFFSKILNDNLLFISTILIVFSYFYNLSVLKYGLIGENELRIYDIVGIVLLYKHYKYRALIISVIAKVSSFRWFWNFFRWAGASLVLTLLTGVFLSKYLYFLQTILYYYHLYIFFISGVFIYILSLKANRLTTIINFIFIFSILTNLVVVLQNFGLIPFLWSDFYKESYSGFLSGTLGPNKIVLGITSLFMFIFAVSVLLEKKIKVNFFLTVLALLMSFYVLIISGSRTAYIGGFVFIGYFAFFSFGKFISFSTIFIGLLACIVIVNDDLYDKAEKVVTGRIIKKVRNKEDLTNGNVGNLYSDLGSGRKELSEANGLFLIENPIVIPFGMGFNNRLITIAGSSAHNMYIQIIKELGIVGFVLYFGWLLQFLFVNLKSNRGFSIGLKGLVLALIVTSYFGEQLYIYRALFGLLGLFCVVTSLFMAILHKQQID